MSRCFQHDKTIVIGPIMFVKRLEYYLALCNKEALGLFLTTPVLIFWNFYGQMNEFDRFLFTVVSRDIKQVV